MVLLYPGFGMERLLLAGEETNIDLSIAYLENLVRVKPDNRLKLMLARRFMTVNDYKRAGRLLKEVAASRTGMEENPDWLLVSYRLAVSLRDYETARNYAQRLAIAEKDPSWYEKAAEAALHTNDYAKAIEYHEAALRTESDHRKRFPYFRGAVEAALWGGDYGMVKRLISLYGKEFSVDVEMAQFVLASALATGDVSFARTVALVILTNLQSENTW